MVRNSLHSVYPESKLELVELYAYLCQLHHHVSKNMKEPHNSVPQSAVGQGLLVASAWTLTRQSVCYTFCIINCKCLICPNHTWIYSVRLLKICFATVIALEKFFFPGSSMTSFPE